MEVVNMSKNSEHVKDYKRRLKEALLFMFGNECCFCQTTENLEFSHKTPDEMNGMGRGSYKRYIYIKNNPERFLLLCHDCHVEFDTIGINLMSL